MSKTENTIEIRLPKLGESISEATILAWLVEVGDVVEEGQALLEVATDKVDSEVPALHTGKITSIKASADDVVKINQVLATMEITDEAVQKIPKEKKTSTHQPAASPNPMPVKQERKIPVSQTAEKTKGKVLENRNDNRFFTPLVRKIAIENHISYEELARIPATGKDGRLRKSDIFKYIQEGRPAQFVQTIPESVEEEKTTQGFQIPDLNLDKGTGK